MVLKMSEAARTAKRRYEQEWRNKNREHLREYQRKWKKENRDKLRLKEIEYWERKAVEYAAQNGN